VVANANSFLTLVDARSMALDMGLAIDVDDTIAETQLRQGYYQLVKSYQNQLQGTIVDAAQTGIFPRHGVVANGFNVPSDSIPVDVQRAQLTYSDSINKGTDFNQTASDQELKKFDVQGVYIEEYKDGSSARTTPLVPAVTQWLQPYMMNGTLTRDEFFYS
jgi:hypothetical protein